jgi:NTE family protein
MPDRPPTSRRRAVAVDLALQGGGSHGAFTWGVLDRLLEDASIAIDGVSGTSAGALNAGVLATGWAAGGRDGARAALRAFWLDVAGVPDCFGEPALGGAHGAVPGPWSAWFGALPLAAFNPDANPFFALFQQALRSVSPYQWNPFGPNALGQVARRHVDPAAMRDGPLKLFVTATAVRSGQPRVFSGQTLTLDALLASACLPQLFKAVEIEGQPYWDGGYSGNPALWPLIYDTAATDLLLVKVNPLWRPGTPDTAAEITDRVNEITFNAGLVAEMRAIHFVQRLLAEHRVDPSHYKSLRLHMVADDAGLAPLQPSSKLVTDRHFLERLHGLGRAAAERWLKAHRRDLGRRSTLDAEAVFLAPRSGPVGG